MTRPIALALTLPAEISRTRRVVTELSLALAGTTLMVLSAQVRIPWQPVPFTLQTMVLMLVGLSLGARLATLSQLVYLGLGAAGLSVFSGGTSGSGILFGPTGGYLLSFILVSIWLGFAAERGWDRKAGTLAFALLVGIALNLGLGWAVLSSFVGPKMAWQAGVAPFLLIEAAKASLVTLALPSVVGAVQRSLDRG